MDIPKLTKATVAVPLVKEYRGANVKVREIAGTNLEVDMTDSESDTPVLLSGPNDNKPDTTLPYVSLSNRSVTYSGGEDTVIVESGDEHFILKHKITFKLYNSQLANFLREEVLGQLWYLSPFDFTRNESPAGVEYLLDISYKTLTNIDWKFAMMLGEYLHCLSRVNNINVNSKHVALKVCLLRLMLAEVLMKFPKSKNNKHLDSFVDGLIEATVQYDFIKLHTNRDNPQKDAALDVVHSALGDIRKMIDKPFVDNWRIIIP